jgi:hypothetical protein
MNMKQKIFALLALVCMTLTASAIDVPTYSLTKADGAEAHGKIAITVNDQTAETAAEGDVVTVTITPDEGWVVNEPTGQWYAAVATAPQRRADVGLLNAVTLTPVPDAENQWTFTMQRANAEIGATYKKLLTNPDITIEDIPAQTYTGKALTPTVTVKDGSAVLAPNTDYTLKYADNTNAGTATVTITAVSTSENYAGETSVTFTINKADGSIAFAEPAIEKTYGDEDFTNAVTVTGDGDISYSSSNQKVASVDAKTGVVSVLRKGTTTITATLATGSNYKGASTSFTLTVNRELVEDGTGRGVTRDADGYHFAINENVATGKVIGSEYDKVASLEYTRTLRTEGKTAVDVDNEQRFLFTLCVPFEPRFDARFYTLAAVEGQVLRFEEKKNPNAFTPYLVAVTEDVCVTSETINVGIEDPFLVARRADATPDELSVDIMDLDFNHAINHGTPVDGYQLKGTLRGLTNGEAAAEGAYIMQNSGTWGAVKAGNEKVYIPLFRAYIVAASQNAQELNSGFEGSTTAITHIVTVDSDGTERWYDLNGRRIERPATEGIYIHNGKKVAIK